MKKENIVLDAPAYIDPTSRLFGKVTVRPGASIWCNAVIRAEMHEVVIGKRTNIQDFVMIHIGLSTPTVIGRYCSITHHCTLHGCTIGDNCLIGINSTIMDGAVIGNNCIVGGHTLVKEGTVIPDNSIVMGTPGVVVKTKNCSGANRMNALAYYYNALAYAGGEYREWSHPAFFETLMKELEVIDIDD